MMKTIVFPLAAALLAAASSLAAPEAGMRSLFNGKDLSGWDGEGYVVEDGAIVCTPQGRNLVFQEVLSN